MLGPRFEELFREEARRVLGAGHATAEGLIREVMDFVASGPPGEVAVFVAFLRSAAAGLGPAAQVAPSATVAQPGAPDVATAPDLVPERQPDSSAATAGAVGARKGPFRVSFPAPVPRRPASSPPPPRPEPEGPEPPPDDVEDFAISQAAS